MGVPDWMQRAPAIMPLVAMAVVAGSLALRGRARETHRRGARVMDGRCAQRRARRLQKRFAEAPLLLAGVSIPARDETKHFKIIGTTGTGKSTAISGLMQGALGRGDRAVITDPDGGYLARFHQRGRGDVILNPFEVESVRWDPFAELGERWDVDQLASGLIPMSDDASGREWRGYARTFVTAVTRRCHECGERDPAELWRLLTVASTNELRPIVSGGPAQPFLEPENARMFGSIRSVTASAVAAFEHLAAQRGRPFSVRSWVRTGRGVLFIPYRASQIAALRSIIATWVRLAIFEAMRFADNRRLWFVVDELDSLGAIDGLKDALARLRKFGGRCVLSFQSVAQVSGTYGLDADTIIENCGTTLILRCAGSERGGTSQVASRLIGEREVLRRQVSRGRDREGWLSGRGYRRTTQVSEHRITETAVMASELEQLPDLTGYLKLASSSAWLRVSFKP